MNFFTRQGRTLLLSAAALAFVTVFTLSCSKKCGDKAYDAKTQFCCNNRDIVDKCGGSEYNPETQFCNESNVVEKCGGKEYDLAAQFCYNNSIVADKCDGKEYNAETKFCLRNELLDRCGTKEYDPETQFCDTRDSGVYKFVKIKTQTWMAENLNYQPQTGKSWCYDDNADNCNKYGRLYDWGTAKKVCPTGWHLPTSKEWDNLSLAAGGKKNIDESGELDYYYWIGVGKKLKAKNGWNDNKDQSGNGTDEYGFSALPGGHRGSDGGFRGTGEYSGWWTATDGFGIGRYMWYNDDHVFGGELDKNSGERVRCVQN